MDVLIISNFATIKSESGNDRFYYLAKQLREKAEVEIVLSSFYHAGKVRRDIKNGVYEGLRYTFVEEPGYKKNVCFMRILSHIIWGKRVYKYLRERKKPDVIYCAVPSLTAARKAARYCEKNHIRFIIDIQDLWPEAFEMVLPVPFLFFPMRLSANYIYSRADSIVAVSDTYAKRAAKYNKKGARQIVAYLGAEYNENDLPKRLEHEGICLSYIGTIGASYDIKTMLQAADICVDQYGAQIQCLIMGDGPAMEEIQNYAKSIHAAVEFTGRLSYKDMMKRLASCDIAVNPLRHRAAQSIINKVGDYAIAGLPVVNSQECPEYRNLVAQRQIGMNCKCEDPQDMAEKIMILYRDEALRKNMGRNNRLLANERFNRKFSYAMIVKEILNDTGK